MNLKFILLVSCFVVLALGHRHHGRQGHGGNGGHRHRHRHHWHRRGPFVSFEVREPKGLSVSMAQRSPNATFFGIELYVNQDPSRSNETHCDVCQNSTTITYGKFIVEDEEAVIKKGDVLYYYVTVGDSTNVTRYHMQKMWVTASIIKRCSCEADSAPPNIDLRFGHSTAPPMIPTEDPLSPDSPLEVDDHLNEINSGESFPFECDLDPVTNQCRTSRSDKLTESSQDLERELEVLEAVIEHMRKTSCGSRSTTNMLRLDSSNLPTNNLEQLTSVVQSSLSVNPEMTELASRIRRVIPDRRSSGTAHFDMFSYVDKQKVLYHARLNNLKHITDYDARHSGKGNRRG